MILFALGFVFGAWLLQQQSVLPMAQFALLLLPSIILLWLCHQYRFKCANHLYKLSIVILAALLGFVYATVLAKHRLSDELPSAWEQKNITVIGVVATMSSITEYGERFQFDVEKVLTPNARVPKNISLNFYDGSAWRKENARPSARARAVKFKAGERWQFTVRLKRPHTNYNPHGYDFEAWALANNIRANGSIRNKNGLKKLTDFVWRPSYIVEYCREQIGDRITQVLHNKPYAGVIRALVVGDDHHISLDNWNVYLRTGTNHLMSISSLHITMLAGLAFSVIAFIWRRLPNLVLRMPTRMAATVGGAVVALLYACLAGLSVPTQRTLYMLATFAAALMLSRRVSITRVLAIALLVVVLIDPWAVIAPGFWLSFSAVAVIAYVSVNRLALGHWLKEAVNTQWAVTLGLLPLLILMFNQASIVSPIANALAIPVISLGVVPLAIMGSLLHLDFILQLSNGILELCMLGLDWLASFKAASWQQAAAPVWTVALAILGVLWLLLPRGLPQRWLGLVLLLPMLVVKQPVLALGEMKIVVLDVGQGLAVVIKTATHTMLYDTGNRYNSESDAGSKVIVPYLRSVGIRKLDALMISHDDSDHSGGADSVLAQMPVKQLVSSFDVRKSMVPMPPTSRCQAGQTWVWDDVRFEMVSPQAATYADATVKDNDRSCVIKITSRYGSILLAGDIERSAELSLIDRHVDIASNVLIAPHHGSKTSSMPEFVQAVGAEHTVFTIGYLNRFHHPKPAIEARYSNTGALLYRSDFDGALLVDFVKGSSIQVRSWRKAYPKYWHDKYL